MSQWQLDSGAGHPPEVHPIDDLRPHHLVTTGKKCWCSAEQNEDGVIVHNAADEREAFETGARKTS